MLVCPLSRDETLNTYFPVYLAFSLMFLLLLQVSHKFCCAPRGPAVRIYEVGGTCPRQLYGAGAYVIISMTICNNNFTIAISTGRGATGSIHPRNLSCEGSAYDA